MLLLIITFSVSVIIFLSVIYGLIQKQKKTIKNIEDNLKERAEKFIKEERIAQQKEINHEIELLNNRRKAAQERLNDAVKYEKERVAQAIETLKEQEYERLKHEIEKKAMSEFDNLDAELRIYKINREQEITKILETQRVEALGKIRLEHEEVLAKMLEERTEAENILGPLRKELEDYRSKREAINQDILRSRELELKQDFHKIILDDLDKEDISYLLSIEGKINNKEVIRKLIWSAYLIKPTNEMINRVLEGKSPSGIYKITDSKGRVYIGKSTNIKNRWIEHIKSSVKVGTIAQQEIHKEFTKQGVDNFTFELLEECDRADLSSREKYYIDFFEAHIYGYNQKRGG